VHLLVCNIQRSRINLGKGKVTLLQTTKAQRRSRDMALLFL